MATAAEENVLQLSCIRIVEDGIFLPWPTRNQTEVPVIEVTRSDLPSVWPYYEDYQTTIQQDINDIVDNKAKEFEELLSSIKEIIQPRRLSIPEAQCMKPVPITPHTKRSRRVRAKKKSSMGSMESSRPTRITRNSAQSSKGTSIDTDDTSQEETRHTQARPKRSTASKKTSFAKPKRSTRSSARPPATSFVALPEIQEIPDTEEGEQPTTTEPVPKKRTVTLKDPRSEPVIPESEVVVDVPHQSPETPKEKSAEIERDSPKTPGPTEGANEDRSPQEEDIGHSPVEVRQLISLHETLIEKQQQSVSQSLRKSSKDEDATEVHASPVLTNTEQTDQPVVSPKVWQRSMAEQVASCIRKNPAVNVTKLKLSDIASYMAVVDSPMEPITLAFDASDGEEDIADSIDEYQQTENIPSADEMPPHASVGTARNTICPSRIGSNLQMRLSFGESELDNSAGPSGISVDQHDENTAELHSLPDEDNIESVEKEGDQHSAAGNETVSTVSQASLSVCSSSAATVVLESDIYPVEESESLSSETEEHPPPIVWRSTRHSKKRSAVGGLSTKEILQSDKLAAKRQATEAKARKMKVAVPSSIPGDQHSAVGNETVSTISQASLSVCSSSAATVVLESDINSVLSSDADQLPLPVLRRSTRHSKKRSVVGELPNFRGKNAAVSSSMKETESGVESDIMKKKHKIPKPVIKSQRKLRTNKLLASESAARVVSRAGKRNLDAVGTPGQFSPAPPKSKQMRCASPLCQEKSKTKASVQRSRNTFLNRSTAASRVRRTARTPGHASPATFSRTRAALLAGSPFRFPSQATICLSPVPRPANLTVGVQSFIRRNTPQKVNYEDQLAAKKEQLEQKSKREEEAKRRKEEEKQIKILEKRRKQEERERKVAEQREKREREQREKQQKQVEQWEKRVADADKGKVIRKKEETAKAKKLRKKQAEAEEIRRREEEERVKKLKEQEQEKEQRLLEQKLQRDQEAAARKQAEQEKVLEKQRQDKLREDKEAEEARKKVEEEKLKREEEEKAKRKKAEEVLKMKQQKFEKDEAERRRKLQEEVEKKNAEAARIEEERKEREKEAQRKMCEEAQRRQEEAIRKQEKDEARKRKLQETKAAAEAKAIKKKQEELAHAEELRRKREATKRQAEQRREERERAQREEREEEKKKKEEEKCRRLEEIRQSNDKLRKLEEAHKKERERLREMNPNATMDKSLNCTPQQNRTFTLNPNTTNESPQTYDMTPRVKKTALSTLENYNIDDLASGDSTDDDDRPRKVVPKWAKGGNMKSQLIKQCYNPPDLSWVFRDAFGDKGIRLDQIFNSVKARYFKRTSSANWNSPIMPVGHMSFTDQCRGFDLPS